MMRSRCLELMRGRGAGRGEVHVAEGGVEAEGGGTETGSRSELQAADGDQASRGPCQPTPGRARRVERAMRRRPCETEAPRPLKTGSRGLQRGAATPSECWMGLW